MKQAITNPLIPQIWDTKYASNNPNNLINILILYIKNNILQLKRSIL